ncbi:MAG: C25 family cysteine peptidase, partial [candidate division WOR-3 bacterium]
MKRVIFLLIAFITISFAAGAKYLIITHDNFYNAIQPLAEWKHKKGVPTKVVKLSEIGATADSIARIKNYIVNAYNTWNPAPQYVLLVGNANFIKTEGPNYYDDYYGNMTGNYLMEISVGRIHCANNTQCSTQVAKILGYERTPYLADTLWYKKGTFVIREDYAGYPPINSDTIYWNNLRYIRDFWSDANYVQIDSLTKNFGNNSTDVINAISNGRAYVVYRGQGVTYWWSPFDAVDPNSMTNGFRLPVVVSATCATMSLASSNYYGDRFVNGGNPTVPKGAVAFLGTTQSASGDGLARVRGTVATGFFRSIFKDNVYCLGDAFRRAKFILDSIGTVSPPPNTFPYNSTRYREWNLLGDPELNLWTGIPRPMNVTCDSIIYSGPQSYTVVVKDGITPINNALVCVMMNDTVIYQYGYTNSAGTITFSINPTTTGNMSVTVTAHNYIPFEKNVSVIPGGLAHDVGIVSIVQPIGTITAGSSIIPKVKIKNYGSYQETFPVTFKIGVVYNQTIPSVTLNANDTITVSFPSWIAVFGNYTAMAYTGLSTDQWRNNDTLNSSFSVVNQHDVGVLSIITPKDSISRGLSIIPKAVVKNFGGNTEIFSATFKIDNIYSQTVNSINLAAGAIDTIEFPIWLSLAGNYQTQCYTNLSVDNDRTNDTVRGAVFVRNDFLTEGFNDVTFPPPNWTSIIISGSYNWARVTSGSNPSCTPYEGAGMAFYNSYNAVSGSQARLITPPIELGATPTLFQVKFNMYHDNSYPGGTYGPDSVILEYSTDGNNFIRVVGFRRYEPTNGWAEHYATIGPLSGIVYVGFRAFSQYGTNIFIDNVRVLPPPPADVGVFSIESPVGRLIVGTPTNITGTVKCYGGNNAIFSTRAIVIDSITGNIVFSKDTMISLMVDSSRQITFGQFVPQTNKVYNVVIATNLTSDADPSNDTMEARAKTTPGSDPDGAGYFYESSQNSIYGDTVGYNWFDISSRIQLTGWTPSLDDGNVTVILPFSFPFYGQLLDSIRVCSNGFLQFPTAYATNPNRSLPFSSINNFIGPLWDDLDLRTVYTPAGKVYQYNDPSNNFVIFQWDSVPRYNQNNQRNTFQVILYKNGKIKFQYKRVSQVSDTSCTIGIQGGIGANNYYQQYVVNGSPSAHKPTAQTAILFTFNKDASPLLIEAPNGVVDSGFVTNPVAVIANYGPNPISCNVKFEINDGYSNIQTATIAGNSYQVVSFAPWTARYFGNFITRCSTMLGDDYNSGNNVLTGNVQVRFHDVGIHEIVSPTGTQYTGQISVRALVKNYYHRVASCTAYFLIRDDNNNIVFSQQRYVANLLPDSSNEVEFGNFNALVGTYYTQCYTKLTTDDNPLNDTVNGTVVVLERPEPAGWLQQTNFPTQLTGKYVKDGGALVATSSGLFAFRGNNSREFYKYDGVNWYQMTAIPNRFVNDKEVKKNIKKGAALTYDGDNKIFAIKGGGSNELWQYNISENQWSYKTEVPISKGLKGGSKIVFGNGKIYLLAGSVRYPEQNFFAYDTITKNWQVCARALYNPDYKAYKDGSDMTLLEDTIYVLKGSAKNNYFVSYYITLDQWTMRESIPLLNPRTNKKVKVKNGGALTNDGYFVYAIKGGGSNEFWQYNPQANSWTRKETIPALPYNKKSVPKGGAALAFWNHRIYLLKGNNTQEFWSYQFGYYNDIMPTNVRIYDVTMTEQSSKLSQLEHQFINLQPNPCQNMLSLTYYVPIRCKISVKLY